MFTQSRASSFWTHSLAGRDSSANPDGRFRATANIVEFAGQYSNYAGIGMSFADADSINCGRVAASTSVLASLVTQVGTLLGGAVAHSALTLHLHRFSRPAGTSGAYLVTDSSESRIRTPDLVVAAAGFVRRQDDPRLFGLAVEWRRHARPVGAPPEDEQFVVWVTASAHALAGGVLNHAFASISGSVLSITVAGR